MKLVVIHSTFGVGNKFRYMSDKNIEISFQEHNAQTKTNHQTDLTSYLLENPSHSTEFDQLEILATANNSSELLIKETLLIHAQNPSINLDESSNPLLLFNT